MRSHKCQSTNRQAKKKSLKFRELTLTHISFSAYQEVQLSTINQPKERMGRIAGEILIDEIEAGEKKSGPRKVILEPELIVRKSSCNKKGGADGRRNCGDPVEVILNGEERKKTG
ncbi:MAG: substrate-binding domain-containing protein [Spirochaetia bacterium]